MNNTYFKRHEENIQTAEFLINEKGSYCSSIHCSYYSVFQLLLHIHKIRNSEIAKNRNKLDMSGSHQKVINETYDIIFSQNKTAAVKFHREMNNLKDNRKVADYDETYIDKKRSETVYQMAQQLIVQLTDIFLKS